MRQPHPAVFELKLISERTRGKVFAARRKGKWRGSQPMLGYDLNARGGKIHVNEEEARRVREIFETYARTRSLIRTNHEIDRRGWTTKSWITRKEKKRGGQRFTRHDSRMLASGSLIVFGDRIAATVVMHTEAPRLNWPSRRAASGAA